MPVLFQICVEGNTGSTGRIAEAIGVLAQKQGWMSYIAHGRYPRPSSSKIIKIGNSLDIYWHIFQTRLFDRHCFGSTRATKKLIKDIEKINPDIIHLHHLHGYYINIKILFNYLSQKDYHIVWTFHDCWAFTGHCAYFDFVECNKWVKECNKCPQKKEYPISWLFDRSTKNYHLKNSLFNAPQNLNIVPVSKWLKDLVQRSFLKNIPQTLIYNGIDINAFTPMLFNSKIKHKYKITNKFVILGVASPWSRRKGLKDFIELSKYINDDMVLVLVGLSKKQVKSMPANIVALQHTENQQELNDLYCCADVFLNPTWEDNFPTTNIEALACGTPIITYDTGGSVEAIDEYTGIVVKKGNISELYSSILRIKDKGKDYYKESCRVRAIKYYNKDERFAEYIDLYNEILLRKKINKIIQDK